MRGAEFDATRLPILGGLAEIASEYDALICDVWGVLHNGREAYLPAADALRRFRSAHGPVILLTNAPRLADGVEALFDRLGLPRDFYDAIVTSGLVAQGALRALSQTGRRLPLFYLGPPRDNPIFEGLNIDFVAPEVAELVLCTGLYDDETETAADYRDLLETFRRRGLVFHCANPDIVVQRGGRLIPCAGAVAQAYENMGGATVYYGKPYPAVFEAALASARSLRNVSRPLVIGDGLQTDIAGANRLNFDALFVAGGIHAADLDGGKDALAQLFQRTGASARAAMASLSW